MYAQFQRNYIFLSTFPVTCLLRWWLVEKKMKAGGNRLPAAVFVFVCNLFFVTSHQQSDLQVRVRFVIVIRSIHIHMESGFGECCIDVSEYCFCNHNPF